MRDLWNEVNRFSNLWGEMFSLESPFVVTRATAEPRSLGLKDDFRVTHESIFLSEDLLQRKFEDGALDLL